MMIKSTKRNKRLAVMVGAALAFGTAYGMTAQTPFIPSAYAVDDLGDGATVTDDTNKNDRIFGKNEAGAVEGINITVGDNGEVKRATGGKSTAGNATNNSVTVQGTAKIGADGVIGGYSQGADGQADSNTVTIDGGDIGGTVEGGRSTQGTANGNTVEVRNGDIDKTGAVAIMGGNGVKGADSNIVTIHSTDGTNNIKGDVIGGNSSRADAAAKVDNNTVTIIDGTITGTIVGAYANGAAGVTATGNAVDIKGGMIDASNANVAPATGIEGIRGAYSTGDVTDNAVSIGGSATITGAVYGGTSADAAANGNSVISGGTINGAVYGGTSGASGGQATRNTVSVTGGAITARTTEACAVIGGYGAGLAEGNQVTIASAHIRGTDPGSGSVTGGASTTLANNNSVTIKAGADIADNVSGGNSDTDAANNQVVMEAGAVGGDIRGGHAVDGSATSNILTIQGGTVSGQVAGGRTDSGLGGEASGNKLYMTDGTVKAAAAGYAAGTGNVTANELYMTGGTVNGSGATDGVAAGYSLYGNAEGNVLHLAGGTVDSLGGVSGGASGTGSAADNTLIMTGGTVANSAQGGYSLGGVVSGNTFKVSGGTIGKSAYGGISQSGKAEDNTLEISGNSHITTNAVGGEGKTEANNNTVKITGGTIDHNVYGGFGHKDGTPTTAAGNQIFISGSPTFSAVNTDIVAARVSTAAMGTYDNLTSGGNNISFGTGDALTGKVNVNAITADTIAVNSLGGAALNAGSAAITAKNVNATTIDVSKIALDRVVGEDFTILEGTDNLNVATVNDGTVTMGTTLQQDVGRNGNKIGFKAGTRRVQGQTTHAVLNAQAGIAALAAGNTLIDRAVSGLDAFGAAEDPREWRAFMYTGGGRAEYDTGSSVTNHTWSGIVGIGRHDQRKDGGALNYGLFYEYGRGNYTTDDSAGRGDGNAHYMGGGLLARNETDALAV